MNGNMSDESVNTLRLSVLIEEKGERSAQNGRVKHKTTDDKNIKTLPILCQRRCVLVGWLVRCFFLRCTCEWFYLFVESDMTFQATEHDAHLACQPVFFLLSITFRCCCIAIVEITASSGIWLKLWLHFFVRVSDSKSSGIASALTTHQSHFAKVLPFSEWSERKRSHYHFLSTKNALCSTCILLLLWKWKMRQNFVHLIDLLLLLAENLETVIFHFDLNIKFQHWILSNALK